MSKEKFNMFLEKLDDECQSIGDAVYDAIEEEDNSSYEMGRGIVRAFRGFETQKEMDAAEAVLIAITGYGLDSIMDNAIELEKEGCAND